MKALARLSLVLVCLGAAGVGAWSAHQWRHRPVAPLHATLLQPARALPAFELIDHQAAPFTVQDLHGRWSILFFGFTHCPDVCPTTLYQLAETVRILRERGNAAPQVVLISVDPQRDSPARLADYVPRFDAEFIGVTGSSAAVEALTRHLGVAVAIHSDPADPDNYTVDHSAALFLIDPQGRQRALFTAPHDAGAIAADIDAITG